MAAATLSGRFHTLLDNVRLQYEEDVALLQAEIERLGGYMSSQSRSFRSSQSPERSRLGPGNSSQEDQLEDVIVRRSQGSPENSPRASHGSSRLVMIRTPERSPHEAAVEAERQSIDRPSIASLKSANLDRIERPSIKSMKSSDSSIGGGLVLLEGVAPVSSAIMRGGTLAVGRVSIDGKKLKKREGGLGSPVRRMSDQESSDGDNMAGSVSLPHFKKDRSFKVEVPRRGMSFYDPASSRHSTPKNSGASRLMALSSLSPKGIKFAARLSPTASPRSSWSSKQKKPAQQDNFSNVCPAPQGSSPTNSPSISDTSERPSQELEDVNVPSDQAGGDGSGGSKSAAVEETLDVPMPHVMPPSRCEEVATRTLSGEKLFYKGAPILPHIGRTRTKTEESSQSQEIGHTLPNMAALQKSSVSSCEEEEDDDGPDGSPSDMVCEVSRVDCLNDFTNTASHNSIQRRKQILQTNFSVPGANPFALDDDALSPKERILAMHDEWTVLEQEVVYGLVKWSTEKAKSGEIRLRRDRSKLLQVGHSIFCMKYLQKLVSSPSSKWRLWWDALGILLLTSDLVAVPLQVFNTAESDFQIGMRWASAAFWTLDIIFSFFVGYHNNGIVEMNLLKVFKNYVTSWFLLDMSLASLDWTFLILALVSGWTDTAGSKTQGAARLAKISRFMRAFRLLRLMKFRMVVTDLSFRIRTEELRTFFYIVKLIMIILFVNHFVGCCFYGLHYIQEAIGGTDVSRTWVNKYFSPDDSMNYRYWTSLHWSLTQFTPASMEVVPVNELERFYTVCVLLFAMVTFSSFISSITTAMTVLRQNNARKMVDELSLRRFLVEHNISAELTQRIVHFTHERSHNSRLQVRSCEENTELVKSLPESLKHALRKEFFTPIVSGHPLFAFAGLIDLEIIPTLCKRALVEKHLVRRDEIFGHGKEVTHMLFIVSGALTYTYSLNGVEISERLKAPTWACEIVLWTQWPERCNAFIADSPNCDLAILSAAEFRTVATSFHSISKGLVRYAASFIQEAIQMSRVCRAQLVVGVDQDRVKEKVTSAFNYVTDPAARFAHRGRRKPLERSYSTHSIRSVLTGHDTLGTSIAEKFRAMRTSHGSSKPTSVLESEGDDDV